MRLLLVAAALQVGAFSPSGDGRPPSRLRAEDKPKDPIISADGWPRVKALLNRLPVFTVANEQGQPLQYEADGKPLALLYADVDAAKSELKSAKEEHPTLGLDIVPMGLGEAFQLHRTGAAVLIPSQDSMEAAGAPKGASPLGQELPLFACMEMKLQGDAGPKGSTRSTFDTTNLPSPHHPTLIPSYPRPAHALPTLRLYAYACPCP